MLYEKRILNGEPIVVVFKKKGVKDAREKYPNTPIYSIREIEALEGLETAEGGRKPIEEKKYLKQLTGLSRKPSMNFRENNC